MPSQPKRKTKPLPHDRPVTRADLLILARAVDQSIADLRAELDARLPKPAE